MACDYLPIPASSMPSEEANSEARDNFKDRKRLHSCTFKAEMCIWSWLDLLDSVNIPVPEDTDDAYNCLEINLEEMMVEDEVIEYLYLDKWFFLEYNWLGQLMTSIFGIVYIKFFLFHKLRDMSCFSLFMFSCCFTLSWRYNCPHCHSLVLMYQ